MVSQTLPEPRVATAQPCSKGHVLVVDDEEPNRLLLRDPLEALGYSITEAVNGPDALRSMTKTMPDLVLLDVMMPGMDGFQVCRRLKKDPRTAHIPVLMVTALSERKERLMGIEAGANDFLNKPVDIQDLTLRVANGVYAKNLFDQLQVERDKSDRLLLNTLPRVIAERMKGGEYNIADHYPEVTVLVADLVGFTALTVHIDAHQVVSLLNEIFTTFDLLAEERSLEKIKTIGDAYMIAGGLPEPRPDHAEAVANYALEMLKAVRLFNEQYQTSIQLRIGIATGPVIAGVIGRKKFAYDIWGDTVNLACRLEAYGQPGTILANHTTYLRLKAGYDFDNEQVLDLKGRGATTCHRLVGQTAPRG